MNLNSNKKKNLIPGSYQKKWLSTFLLPRSIHRSYSVKYCILSKLTDAEPGRSIPP